MAKPEDEIPLVPDFPAAAASGEPPKNWRDIDIWERPPTIEGGRTFYAPNPQRLKQWLESFLHDPDPERARLMREGYIRAGERPQEEAWHRLLFPEEFATTIQGES